MIGRIRADSASSIKEIDLVFFGSLSLRESMTSIEALLFTIL
jgi:hypothetical protein